MDKNHRNLIRRCEKDGVRVEVTTDPEAVEGFNQMHDVTVKRHHFHRFPSGYVRKEFNALSPHNAAVIKAYLPDGTLDSVGIFMFYGSMSCYRHAASLMSDKRLPSPMLYSGRRSKKPKNVVVLFIIFGVWPRPTPIKITHFMGLLILKKALVVLNLI